MKPVLLACLVLFISAHIMAQEFPETENDIYKLLVPSSWNIKYMLIDDRKLDAEKVNMKASLQVFADSTYSLNFLGEVKKGKLEVNLIEKWIRLIDPAEEKDFYIHNVDKNELWLQAYENDGDQPVLILVPAKIP